MQRKNSEKAIEGNRDCDMTEKEFHKLKRQDILRLLLAQVKEAEELRSRLSETEGRLIVAEEGYERLKGRLDDKDTQINRLKERLDSKDAQINKLKGRLDNKDEQIQNMKIALDKLREEKMNAAIRPGSIAQASLELSGIFEAAQRAADLYLEKIKGMSEEASEAGE